MNISTPYIPNRGRRAALASATKLGFGVAVAALYSPVLRAQQAPLPTQLLADSLEHPWAVASLPDGGFLISERPGRLVLIDAKRQRRVISGLPAVHASGQGGLLDVALSPAFATNRLVFWSCSEKTDAGARTAVFRAELDGTSLRQVQRVFGQRQDPSGRLHFGSRLAFMPSGHLLISTGDRYSERDQAQNPNSHLGKIIRIHADGSIPQDNPFSQGGGAPEVFSLGHRNVQGLAVHPVTGEVWAHEHGPQGGDEVNRIEAGQNYGWPRATFGKEYVTGFSIGEGTRLAGMRDPLHVWVPSIAPSGMAWLSSNAPGLWASAMVVGALKARALVRLSPNAAGGFAETRFKLEGEPRIRDVRSAGASALLVLTDESKGRLLRVELQA
jgi:glucose/arabinose dehydrogenase